jgi:phenylacetate-CoA ligase
LAKRNDEFIAVPKDMWTDLVTTTGTTGKPIYIPFTKKDILRNAYFIAKKFLIFGLKKDDVAYITVPTEQSMWIGGLSVWLGCLKIGTCSLRAGNVSIDKHTEFIERFRPTVIFGLPSFILKLGEEIKVRKFQKIKSPRLIVTFGENVMNRDFSRNTLGKNVERLWGAKVISLFGSTEGSPGIECIFQLGHHVLPEMVYIEIIDPKTLNVLKPQEEGLVVMTHFGREGLPLIRYANGDISFLVSGKCKCKRIGPRLGPVLGRIDEMVKIKGVNLYPSQIENFLLGIPFIHDFFIELFTDKNSCDKIKVNIKFKEGFHHKEKTDKLIYLQNKLKEKISVKIELEEMKGYRKDEGWKIKKSHIIDTRTKKRS